LYDREVKHYTDRITVPADFPDDLLDKRITLFLKANVITEGTGTEVDYFTFLVTMDRSDQMLKSMHDMSASNNSEFPFTKVNSCALFKKMYKTCIEVKSSCYLPISS
jgi:hypothetical protein